MTPTGPRPAMVTRLVADRVVPVEPDGTVLQGGAVDIGGDGRIVACGAEADLPPPTGERLEVGGLLMPGLVNAHAHTPMTLMRSVGDGMPLMPWLTDAVWPREGRMSPDDALAGMLLGSVEMLRAGVTTSCELYLFEDAVVEAVRRTGGRLVITPGVLSVLHAETFGSGSSRGEAIADFAAAHHDPDSTVTVGVGPHSIYDLTPDQVGELAAVARRLDTFVHIHLEETEAERRQVIAAHGRPATELLAEAGVFDGPVLAAHGVWLTGSDRAILAGRGVSIAHNPVSNLKLGSGVMPLSATLEAGINVALGTDGPASNDNLSLWQELALAPLLARGMARDPGAIDAVTALRLATVNGGQALGLPVGALKAGNHADIIRLDLDHPALSPAADPELITSLVFCGGPQLVTDVWVAGQRVVRDGAMTTVDEQAIAADATRRAARLATG